MASELRLVRCESRKYLRGAGRGNMTAPRRRQPTETEGIMRSAARILTVSPEALQPEERAAEILSIGPGNEREYECPH
jgi:hypothetical protein